MNAKNAEIFEKIYKLNILYGLEVHMESFFSNLDLFFNNSTPEHLFSYTKDSIM
jgi:hypothetical protein